MISDGSAAPAASSSKEAVGTSSPSLRIWTLSAAVILDDAVGAAIAAVVVEEEDFFALSSRFASAAWNSFTIFFNRSASSVAARRLRRDTLTPEAIISSLHGSPPGLKYDSLTTDDPSSSSPERKLLAEEVEEEDLV